MIRHCLVISRNYLGLLASLTWSCHILWYFWRMLSFILRILSLWYFPNILTAGTYTTNTNYFYCIPVKHLQRHICSERFNYRIQLRAWNYNYYHQHKQMNIKSGGISGRALWKWYFLGGDATLGDPLIVMCHSAIQCIIHTLHAYTINNYCHV